MQANTPSLSPILKWAGGKRQLLPHILPLIEKNGSPYVEPFVGGGAVVFKLQPQRAVLNDCNAELINVYRVVRDCCEELIAQLELHGAKNSPDYFYCLRALDRTPEYGGLSPVQRAARMLYLNKTCYNGLYRVNASGQFNAPYGRYRRPNIVNATGLRAMSSYLKGKDILIRQGDYKEVLKGLEPGAFVYLDPPYLPLSATASFTGYTEGGFSYRQQVELKGECDKLRAAGIPFLQSNSNSPEIRALYRDYDIRTVGARRSINSRAEHRGEITEILICHLLK